MEAKRQILDRIDNKIQNLRMKGINPEHVIIWKTYADILEEDSVFKGIATIFGLKAIITKIEDKIEVV